ncbi:antibiotic biosynthesis monooxygenase [Nocardia sp. NEAU-G5]|uniref:Antibiotic biosynthesis monooxygenase n=1 Tax=Nocardia albiluteola TaxID=2842303 RepID=A0ABS6BEC5_9NOCA|nr:antibiotic biosynthesis monooxygenase family protein [Nocardia albiluteola]MBU3067765.1 antibiotic biosynthesis monooxygenase [Nocardia albiluteola]
MVKLLELDKSTTFFQQLASQEEGPIVLVNVFHVEPDDEEEFLRLWKDDGTFMMSHGCISAQLHKGIDGSGSYINVAVWESVQNIARAFQTPEFQEMIAKYPESCTAAPHLYKKIAVPGICVA